MLNEDRHAPVPLLRGRHLGRIAIHDVSDSWTGLNFRMKSGLDVDACRMQA